MTLIDVSHTIESGMVTYKGLPAPLICDYLSRSASRKLYAAGTEFQIGRIDMVANTGTYIDSPFHRYADGKDLSQLPLEKLAGVPCAVARIDSHNIDCTDGGDRPVHSTLLGADIPIVEHLCRLADVPPQGADFFAVPVKIKDFGTFPVRAFAMSP